MNTKENNYIKLVNINLFYFGSFANLYTILIYYLILIISLLINSSFS